MKTQTKLLQILNTESFHELDAFSKPTTWKKMTDEERELLGILFIKHAEKQMMEGDKGVFDTCEKATQVVPDSAQMYYHKGILYAHLNDNMRCLLAASEAFQKAVELAPDATNAWFAWGNVLFDIGHLSEDLNCFSQANEKYERAAQLPDRTKEPLHPTIHWRWGLCLHTIGSASGEPRDLLAALEKYQIAESLGVSTGEFFNDYANLYAILGQLLPSTDFPAKSVEYYRKAVAADPKLYEGWLSLGCTLTLCYQTSADDGDFLDAHQAFEKCVEIDSSEPMAWVRWGHLLACAGKITNDIDKIYASFEKFEAASLLESDMPRLLLHWGEALLMAGVHEERLDLLKDAEAKITRAIRSLSTAEESWVIYGKCLCDLGHYFNDSKYFLEAVEKYQHAMQQFSSSNALALGLAHAQIALGDQTSCQKYYEDAITTFETNIGDGRFYSAAEYNEWGVAWMKLAEITQKCEHAAQAVDKFEQAIAHGLQTMTFNELDSSLLYNYGAAIDFLGDFHNDVSYYEKAVQALAHVVAVDESHPYAKYNLALALFHRAELTHDYDTFHRAIDIIHELSDNDPEDDILWNQYGSMLMTLADLTRDPESEDLMHMLFAEAEMKLKRALACGSVVAHYNLACLYALMGQRVSAVHHLECAEKQDALPPVDEILDEEWLESLHDLHDFRNLIGRQYSDEPPEPNPDMPF